ncbi:MAG: N-acetyltransferase [Clostridia bacterium]|nr:N-acetyltransferase [Clostridia bacterium]
MKNINPVTLRKATEADAKALLDIYAPYILKTGITFEYVVPSEEQFRARICKISAKYPYLVAERNGEIVGYSYAKEFGERAAFSRSAETVLYIKENARGGGIGRLLYTALESILKEQNITNLYAAVAYRETEDDTITHASPRFHLAMGYKKAAHFTSCGYKFDRWYDIIWYEKMIAPHGAEPKPFVAVGEIAEK